MQVLSTESPVDDGHRLASCDTSLVVSGGIDCGRRRRNVYDKKPRRYAKDNRTAHLTARSDKSVAYVTNIKKLYVLWQALHILIVDDHLQREILDFIETCCLIYAPRRFRRNRKFFHSFIYRFRLVY